MIYGIKGSAQIERYEQGRLARISCAVNAVEEKLQRRLRRTTGSIGRLVLVEI